MTYRQRTRSYYSSYCFFFFLFVVSLIVFVLVLAVFPHSSIWLYSLLLSLASLAISRFCAVRYASSFDHALTSRLTGDIWPSGSLTRRQRDRAARVKRSVSGGG